LPGMRPQQRARSELYGAEFNRATYAELGRRAARATATRGGSLSVVIRKASVWEPLDELAPEAHVTLRSDRPVEAQLEDLRALLDGRLGRLTTVRSEPASIAETSKRPATAI
jgi:hypothetical protein